MKTAILQVTLFLLLVTLITGQKITFPHACDIWTPEPDSSRKTGQLDWTEVPVLHAQFRVIENFVEVKNSETWRDVAKEYVVRALDDRALERTEVLAILLDNIPPFRTLFIALACVVTAKLLFLLTWSVCLIDEFRQLGVLLRFKHHRYGLTFFPVVCFLGLLILNSHYKSISEMAHDGVANLRASEAMTFAPVRSQIKNNLMKLICRFVSTLQQQRYDTRFDEEADRYLRETVNGSYLKTSEPPQMEPNTSWQCQMFQEKIMSELANINETIYTGYPDIEQLTSEIYSNYAEMTIEEIGSSLETFVRALSTIEVFVTHYHSDVLQLPSTARITILHVVIVVITIVSMTITAVFVTMSVMMVELKKRWVIILSYTTVFVLVFFSAILVVLFLSIFAHTVYMVLTQTACIDKHFSIFNASRPRVFEENGYTYKINYGHYLAKSFNIRATWFDLIAETTRYNSTEVPIALDGHRMWKPNHVFNGTFESLVKIATNYRDYTKRGCETMEDFVRMIEKLMKSTECREKRLLEERLKFYERLRNRICQDNQPPVPEATIRQRSEAFWKRNLIPHHSYGVMNRESVIDSSDTKQMYLVFINPAVKLQPAVLEPWFGLAVSMLAMAPIVLIMAIYLMCIIPTLVSEKRRSSSEEYQKLSCEKTQKER